MEDPAGVVALSQIGVLEIHPWGARVGRLERPDRLVLDLDPAPGVAWARVVEGALAVRRPWSLPSWGLRTLFSDHSDFSLLDPVLRKQAFRHAFWLARHS